MRILKSALRVFAFLLLSPLLLLTAGMAMLVCDGLWLLAGRRRRPVDARPRNTSAATVVIPNWNGRDLLAKYIPPLERAMAGNPENEILVVDNGSTDGSARFLREQFPNVRVLALEKNLGFGGGSNAGFRAAKNDIVVLLNSDMRVEPDFLAPLLEDFTDEKVFSVGCQIYFADPNRVREETGLTQAWWENGLLRVRHRQDDEVKEPFPCFYGGGGSCAYDRRKFLEIGGFDPLLAPFYMEDTDIGYLAWKRGWKVLYEPRSVVYHEHRGTIGKRFSPAYIQGVLKKNYILFCWKNIHSWRKLGSHLGFTFGDTLVSAAFGDSPERSNGRGVWRAFVQLPQALRSRWRALGLASIRDEEALRRPLGGYFRDRFAPIEPQPDRLRVLFVSPYPLCPPTHGGGVFMNQTARELARHCDVHLVTLLDHMRERAPHEELAPLMASMEFVVRKDGMKKFFGSIRPHAVSEFANRDVEWVIHRQILTKRIDVVQLEYTALAQYRCDFRRIACVLFEHDVYFQSIARALKEAPGLTSRSKASVEYLRALRYELRALPLFDRVQVCSRENKEYLLSFLPGLNGKLIEGLRAGIDTQRYEFRPCGRERLTMLFLGSFRHLPNHAALHWFASEVLPKVLERQPSARLVVAGSDPPAKHRLPNAPAIELRGFVEDAREPLGRYAVFVCPILSGSGVRVKLLEAFAAGIPVVSTTLGAEGLAQRDGQVCLLADDPDSFAKKIVELFDRPDEAAEMAARARKEAVERWDMPAITRRLVEDYWETLKEKRQAAPGVPS